jgi:hypothetical protein
MSDRVAMIGIYIVVGMALVGAIALMLFYHQKHLKMTSKTTGQVVKVEQREVRDERERRDETVIVCQFTVNGHQYTLEKTLRGRLAGRYPAGRTLAVWYNPADPQMSRIEL